jgi:diaminohydroxyphosphoribosylaminopyrimidine deaminase / 5-amino-6-(5-phosphoribosylamino)uracil reductase
MAETVADDDQAFMCRALVLAERGLGRTSPNPAVGCVVVAHGAIVGEGFHARAGESHAEAVALEAAGDQARGATLYVTLEPCCHFGRTPPCTDAILRAGVRRVVYACPDCDERCAGKGAAALAEAGVQITEGVLRGEALRLNETYFTHKRTGRPFVTLKMACSLDGKTATRTGDSRWISGEESRALVHRMRDRSDAVMVGVGTVLRDDPQLTTRLPGGGGRNALRVVVDSLARTPPEAKVVTGEGACLIAVTEAAPAARVEALREAGAEVVVTPDLPTLMAELGGRAIMSVLLEGGSTLAGGAVEAGIVHKLVLFLAPRLLGGAHAAPVLGGLGAETVAEGIAVQITDVQRVGEDIMVEAYLCSPD